MLDVKHGFSIMPNRVRALYIYIGNPPEQPLLPPGLVITGGRSHLLGIACRRRAIPDIGYHLDIANFHDNDSRRRSPRMKSEQCCGLKEHCL